MSEEDDTNSFEQLRERLDEFISRYRHPEQRRIGYGNLRQEYSDWHEGRNPTANIAIVYETPGGSTAQINITYDGDREQFTYLQQADSEPTTSESVENVLSVIASQVAAIPQKRRHVLYRQIEDWCSAGKPVFEELNKLLQSEFLGGRINIDELKDGINYAIACRKRVSGAAEASED